MVFYSRSIADDGKLPETHRRPGPARETPDGQKMSELQGHVGRFRGISDSDRQSKTNSTYWPMHAVLIRYYGYISNLLQNCQFSHLQAKAGQSPDLISSLKKLENSLKSEGSYKNVKVGFEAAKTDVSEVKNPFIY